MFEYKERSSPFVYVGSGGSVVEIEFAVSEIKEETFSQNGVAVPEGFGKMVTKRRCEYLAGRICARLALEKLGQCASEQVWQGQDRCPVWPAGYCGSISHTNNLAIACVARSEGFRSVGIDVERIVAPQLAESVAALVLLDSDKGFAPDFDFNTFLTIVFSAKEALFKAIYPEVGYVFGFEEAAVLRISKEVVTLEIQRDLSDVWLAKTQVNVLYKVKDSLVYSWAVLKPAYTGTFSAPLDETLQKRPVPVVSGCRK